VWWAEHGGPDKGPYPWKDPQAAAWHTRHFFADPPTVIEVRVPKERILHRYRKPLQWAAVDGLLSKGKGLPEVAVELPVPPDWVCGYQVVARRVDFEAACVLLGLTIEELTAKVDSDAIVRCRPPEISGESWYWHFDELEPYLLS
jgi:hypothetical protein